MKIEKAPVSSNLPQPDGTKKATVIGHAEYPVFDSLAEADAYFKEKGGDTALDLLNVQVKTTFMNRVRQSVTGGPSVKDLQAKAMTILATTRQAELTEAAMKGPDALAILVESVVKELKAQAEAEKTAKLAKVAQEVAAGGMQPPSAEATDTVDE